MRFPFLLLPIYSPFPNIHFSYPSVVLINYIYLYTNTIINFDEQNFFRPDIIWFGDMLNAQTIERAADVISRCDLFVSIGTSAVVYPAAQLPQLARQNGALCIEINPEETPVSRLYQRTMRTTASNALHNMCKQFHPIDEGKA